MAESPKSIIKTSVVKFLEHLQEQKDSLEKELSYLLEELRLNSVSSTKPSGGYSVSEVNQIVRAINASMSDYFKKTYTSISVDASKRMRLVIEDLLKLVGGALGEADINEIIQKIESFESQTLMAEEMAGRVAELQTALSDKEKELENLQSNLQEKDNELEILRITIQEKEKELENLQNKLQKKGVEIVTKPRPRSMPSFQFEWFPCISMTKRKTGS